MKRLSAFAIAITSLLQCPELFSQITVPTNFASPNTEYVGWNNLGFSKPLQIRNDFTGPSQPIDVFTNLVQRLRFTEGLGGDGLGNWNNTPNVNKTLLLHDGVTGNPFPPAVSMFNMGRTGLANPSGGARAWMDVGSYMNFESDNMYVGLKDEGFNRKDAIVNWGNDPDFTFDVGYENLRFVCHKV